MHHRLLPSTIARLGAAGLAAALTLPMAGLAQEIQPPDQPSETPSADEPQQDETAQQGETDQQDRQQQQQQQQDQPQRDRLAPQRPGVEPGQSRQQQRQQRQQRRTERQQARRGEAELGVAIAATQQGLEVLRVYPGTAAAEAGLQTGDRIVRFDGQPVESVDALVQVLRQRSPGETVEVVVDRNGQPSTLDVELQASQRSRFDREGLPGRFFEFERRFRQPGYGQQFGPPSSHDDLAAHIQMLQDEIRRLAAEVRDLQVMLGQRPEEAASRLMERQRGLQEREGRLEQEDRYDQQERYQSDQRFQGEPYEDESVF